MTALRFLVMMLAASSAQAAPLPSWMAGSWSGRANGVQMEEHWTTGDGDLMLGMHRDVKPGSKTEFEFLRIERIGEKVTYLAMPAGRPATAFPLKSATATRAVFENLEHDFPQRIIYWRDRGRLCARVEGTIARHQTADEWCWSRMK